MQKIVIVSSQPDKDNPLLVAMLNVLFPECEIQVTTGAAETEYEGVQGEPVSYDMSAGANASPIIEC